MIVLGGLFVASIFAALLGESTAVAIYALAAVIYAIHLERR